MSVAAAMLVAGGGVGAIRYGWGRTEGRVPVWLGWLAIVTALVWLGAGAGAWGVSVVAIAVMLTAMALLAYAAVTDPRRKRRPARAADTVTNDSGIRLRTDGARGLARRFAIFFLVVPAAGATSLLAALAGQSAARAGGWADADSVTLGLLLFPAIWSIVATWLLMHDRPAAMATRLALFAATFAILFLLLR
ncbi:hypothetical protein [Sphingomonas sp.]